MRTLGTLHSGNALKGGFLDTTVSGFNIAFAETMSHVEAPGLNIAFAETMSHVEVSHAPGFNIAFAETMSHVEVSHAPGFNIAFAEADEGEEE